MNTMIPEIDKAQNIHALIHGEQIMLCKKSKRVEKGKYVYLWPSSKICNIAEKNLSIEECIYRKDQYEKHSDCKKDHSIFLLSEYGAKYSKKHKISQVWKEKQKKSRHFATVEYKEINPYSSNEIPNRKLFEQLEKEGLFRLWDIDEGPLKLFTTKEGNTRRPNPSGKIAIYRVHRFSKKDVKITSEDIEGQGSSAKLKKESYDRIMDSIDDYGLKPVLNDDDFNTLRDKLIDIIERFGKF